MESSLIENIVAKIIAIKKLLVNAYMLYLANFPRLLSNGRYVTALPSSGKIKVGH
jgi:hypothetical protein